MRTTTVGGSEAALAARPGAALEPRESAPVLIWAALGVVALALALFAWTRWIGSSDFQAAPKGPDSMSDAKLLFLRVVEISSLGISIGLAYLWLVRPLIKRRTLTFDGMLIITAATLWYQDPLNNYFGFTTSYNANFVNWGNWIRFIPGWDRPDMFQAPQPPVFVGGSYVWWICGAAIGGCTLLRMVRARYPRMSNLGMVSILFCVLMVADLIVELIIIRGEIWSYPGTVHSVTLFAGSRYQFPLNEMVFSALWCTGMASFRFFRDDRGRSIAERGVDSLRIGPRGKNLVSRLAIIGCMHLWFLVAVWVPWSAFATKVDTFPAMPSYMRAGICGEGTDYACPSREFVPVPSRTSLHITPDDPRLPEWVRDRQGLGSNGGK